MAFGVYDFVITHPEGYELAPQFVGNAKVEYDQMKAFEGADFIYAKNWAAYAGDNYGQILSKDREWTVSDRQMEVTNNAFFMHCLPVRRNMIVTDDVIESPPLESWGRDDHRKRGFCQCSRFYSP